jgi:hypothetical protein
MQLPLSEKHQPCGAKIQFAPQGGALIRETRVLRRALWLANFRRWLTLRFTAVCGSGCRGGQKCRSSDRTGYTPLL